MCIKWYWLSIPIGARIGRNYPFLLVWSLLSLVWTLLVTKSSSLPLHLVYRNVYRQSCRILQGDLYSFSLPLHTPPKWSGELLTLHHPWPTLCRPSKYRRHPRGERRQRRRWWWRVVLSTNCCCAVLRCCQIALQCCCRQIAAVAASVSHW